MGSSQSTRLNECCCPTQPYSAVVVCSSIKHVARATRRGYRPSLYVWIHTTRFRVLRLKRPSWDLDTRTSHVEMKVTFNKTDQVNNKHARDKRIQRRVQRTKSPTAHQASKQSVSRSVAAVVRPRFSILYISTYNGLSHVPGTRYIQRVHKRQFSSTYQTARSSRTTLSDHEVWIRSNLICPPYSISPPYIHYMYISTALKHTRIYAYTAKS